MISRTTETEGVNAGPQSHIAQHAILLLLRIGRKAKLHKPAKPRSRAEQPVARTTDVHA